MVAPGNLFSTKGSTEVRQHAGDGRRHEGGNGTAQHRAQAELGQVVATFRGQATDAADLDRDRAEVGEAAQRVGGDQAALVGQAHAGHLAVHDLRQLGIGDEFVDHDLLADQRTDGGGIGPRRADHPGDRGQHVTEDGRQVGRLADRGGQAGHVAEPGQRGVQQRDQGDEGQQHRADVQRQLQAVTGAGRGRIDDVAGGLLHFHLHRAAGQRGAGFRNQQLGHDQGGRCGHDAGCQQVLGVERLLHRVAAAEHAHVGRQHAAGDVGHAADHHGQQFGLGHLGDVRAHGQRRLGLADEDAGADAGGFRAGHAHHLGDRPRHHAHDRLHDVQVVHHAHQRREEDDGRQHLEGEDEAVVLGVHQRAEDETRAFVDEAQHLDEAMAQRIEHVAPARHQDHQRREGDLQGDTGGNQLPPILPKPSTM
ncbi:hypothetical protein G6F57_015017 [Rhizopus arrhizus]|nr:hypothetical protein G6F57_015017 [Rhizopus arrhizus]